MRVALLCPGARETARAALRRAADSAGRGWPWSWAVPPGGGGWHAVPGAPGRPGEGDALGVAPAGDVGDAAHGAGQPPVVEFEGPVEVGALAVVGAVPFGGQGGQFPDGVGVVGPAFGELVAAVLAAQDGVGPLPELGEPGRVVFGAEADPGGGGGPVRLGVEGLGDGAGEFGDLVGEVDGLR